MIDLVSGSVDGHESQIMEGINWSYSKNILLKKSI